MSSSPYPARQLLLLSNSTLHPGGYLEYAQGYIKDFLGRSAVKKVLFVPFALRDHQGYTDKVKAALGPWGFQVEGLHDFADKCQAVNSAQAIFIGGGNTFQLLKGLYDFQVLEAIRSRVLDHGIPYMGSSAGTNVSTKSIHTTNDMPIVFPPSFEALNLVPFNINPHYLDTDPNSTHKGETREERIRQYQQVPGVPPVVALREGSLLEVTGDHAILKGQLEALLFRGDAEPRSYPTGTDFGFLFQELKAQ
ncbi:hypothetical protein TCAL_10667 [Tigriopus californicus]|uniref:dipeptidase E n=1 Tax=Tigriopus californicus TaxID=6832 RepID=A0A553NYN6_TIGCA|nr:probable alpha-aspartyl dipeptidase [Tigriopus californicus]TRY70522.1 hypothetical protein TCAL_10667 [Tigriopus californicus]|eukprot:TCALIF_10667-PA protein Name:"Similar to aad-a Alpha-aspartyl dipeptidase (Xenopus laevis)" AED:0.07 eAED:0.07 QI:197/1/0.66/1/1/0.66/3/0/249